MSRAAHRIEALLAAIAILAGASIARADDAAPAPPAKESAPLRVLFVTGAPSPFSERVRAEIEAMGFSIEPLTGLSEGATTTAVAAARVVESPARRVELWIADPASGKLTLRALVMPSPEGDEAVETVRASEQLRAFFQPLRERPSKPPPRVDPAPIAPPPRADPAPPREPAWPRFVVGADVSMPLQPGGPGLDLTLRGRFAATRVLGVGAFVSVPIVGSTVQSSEGKASITAPLFGGELALVGFATSAVRVTGTAGLALAWVRTSGFASAPYYGRASDVAAALALLGGELAPRLTTRVRLAIAGNVGASLPRVDVAFAGRTVAVWGRPLGVLSAGVRVDL